MRGEKYIVDVGPELDSGKVQEWLKSLNVLLRSTMIYSLNLEMNSALNVMMDLTSDIVEYDKGIIYMLDEDENKYHPALMRGFEEPLHAQMVQGNIIVDWTVENRQPVRVNDPDNNALEDLAKISGCQSVLSVPISHENKVKGVLQLFRTGAHSFGDEHVRMVWILALQLEGMFHRLLKLLLKQILSQIFLKEPPLKRNWKRSLSVQGETITPSAFCWSRSITSGT